MTLVQLTGTAVVTLVADSENALKIQSASSDVDMSIAMVTLCCQRAASVPHRVNRES